VKVRDALQAARLHGEFLELGRLRSSLRAAHRRIRIMVDSATPSMELEMHVRFTIAQVLQDRQVELIKELKAIGCTDLPEVA
jgi:hypothetical protein